MCPRNIGNTGNTWKRKRPRQMKKPRKSECYKYGSLSLNMSLLVISLTTDRALDSGQCLCELRAERPELLQSCFCWVFFVVVAVNVQVLGCDEKKGIPSLDRFNCQISYLWEKHIETRMDFVVEISRSTPNFRALFFYQTNYTHSQFNLLFIVRNTCT